MNNLFTPAKNTNVSKLMRSTSLSGCVTVLEPRYIFDAAALASGAGMAADIAAQSEAGMQIAESLDLGGISPQSFLDAAEMIAAASLSGNAESSKTVVFADAHLGAEALKTLESGLVDNAALHLIDADSDALSQMAAVLNGYQGIDSVHVVSHGGAGVLALGNADVDFSTLNSSQESALRGMSAALSNAGDILIYGCDFAAGEIGQNAVDTLANFTGADIAASSDATGALALGADWNLEVTSGLIESQLAFSSQAQQSFNIVLAYSLGDANTVHEADLWLDANDRGADKTTWKNKGSDQSITLTQKTRSLVYLPGGADDPMGAKATDLDAFHTTERNGKELWSPDAYNFRKGSNNSPYAYTMGTMYYATNMEIGRDQQPKLTVFSANRWKTLAESETNSSLQRRSSTWGQGVYARGFQYDRGLLLGSNSFLDYNETSGANTKLFDTDSLNLTVAVYDYDSSNTSHRGAYMYDMADSATALGNNKNAETSYIESGAASDTLLNIGLSEIVNEGEYGVKADVAEYLFFRDNLDRAEITVVSNYLAAKWGQSIHADADKYAGDGDDTTTYTSGTPAPNAAKAYDSNIASGKDVTPVTSSTTQTGLYDDGVVGLLNLGTTGQEGGNVTTNTNDGLTIASTSLAQDASVFMGYKVVTANDITTATDASARQWYIDSRDAAGAAGINTVDLTFNLADSGITTKDGAQEKYRLLKLDSNDGIWKDFAGASSVSSSGDAASAAAVFSGVSLDGTGEYRLVYDLLNDKPATLDLAAADDDGVSTGDNITTQYENLTFTVSAEPGSTVQLFDGANLVGTMTETSSYSGSFTIDVDLGAAGTKTVHNLTVVSTDPAGNVSAASDALAVTVDNTPSLLTVTRTDPTAETTNADTLEFTLKFDEVVLDVTADDFDVTVDGGTPLAGGYTVAGSGDTYTLEITDGSIMNANGDVTVALRTGQNIKDEVGNTLLTATGITATQKYILDNIAPKMMVTRVSNASERNQDTAGLVFDLTFDKPMNAATVDAADFAVKLGGTALDANTDYSVAFSSGDTYKLTLLTSKQNTAITENLTVEFSAGNDAKGVVGNTATVITSAEGYVIDNQAPAVLSLTVTDDQGTTTGSVTNGDTIDDTIPSFDVALPISGDQVRDGDIVTVTYTVGGVSTDVSVTLDAGSLPTGLSVDSNGIITGTLSIAPSSALGDGAYSVTAKITDAQGNVGADSAASTFTIDTRTPDAPTITEVIDNDDPGSLINRINLTINDGTPSITVTVPSSAIIDDSLQVVITDAGGAVIETLTPQALAGGIQTLNFPVSAMLADGTTYTATATVINPATGAPSTASTATFTYDVSGPDFANDAAGNATRTINENITVIFAEDELTTEEESGSDTVTYDLSGTDAAKFKIVPGTGGQTFQFITAPNYETIAADSNDDGVYEVTLEATDSAGNLSTRDFTITVADVDEFAPAFDTNQATKGFSITDPNAGLVIGSFPATDADATNNTVTYTKSVTKTSGSGTAGDADFVIDAATGELTLASAASKAKLQDGDVYSVVITATSTGTVNPTHSETTTLNISANAKPVFTVSAYQAASSAVNVAENASASYSFAATDSDGDDTKIVYTISGNDEGQFAIVASTGELTFAAHDYENPADAGTDNVYNVTVTATDEYGMTETHDLALTVDNVDPGAPTFALLSDTNFDPATNTDNNTSNGMVNVTVAKATDTWEYSLDGGSNYTAGGTGNGSFDVPEGVYGATDIKVKVTDATSGGAEEKEFFYGALTVDKTAPVAFGLALNADSGSVANVTDNGTLKLPTANLGAGETLEYRVNKDGAGYPATWTNLSATTNFDPTSGDGVYEVEVRMYDTAGNVTTETISYTVKTGIQTPNATLANDTGTNMTDTLTNDATITPPNNETDADVTVEYSLDGTNWTTDYSSIKPTVDGPYTVSVRQTDGAGNNETQTISFTLDATAPVITGITASFGDSLNAAEDDVDQTATVTTTGVEDGQLVTVTHDGNSYTAEVKSNKATFTILAADLQALADGSTQGVTVNVADEAGNLADEFVDSFTVDTTAPMITGITASFGTGLNAAEDDVDQTATVTTTGVEDGQLVTVTHDGNSYTAEVKSNKATFTILAADLQALADGSTQGVTVNVADEAGNLADEFVDSFIVDRIAPVSSITFGADNPLDDGTVNLAEAAAGVSFVPFDPATMLASDYPLTVSVTWGGVTKTMTYEAPPAVAEPIMFAASEIVLGSNETMSIVLTDAAGNSSTTEHGPIKVDAIPAVVVDNGGGASDATVDNQVQDVAGSTVGSTGGSFGSGSEQGSTSIQEAVSTANAGSGNQGDLASEIAQDANEILASTETSRSLQVAETILNSIEDSAEVRSQVINEVQGFLQSGDAATASYIEQDILTQLLGLLEEENGVQLASLAPLSLSEQQIVLAALDTEAETDEFSAQLQDSNGLGGQSSLLAAAAA